jgi:hypothetical protein
LGFFQTRHQIDFGIGGGDNPKLLKYRNVPQSIGFVLSSKMATLVELQTVLGMEDVYDLIEVISIDNYNQRVLINGNNH